MADQPTQKTLEMRVAELEDKLSKLQISEEDMKTYHKVSAALGGGGAALSPQVCQTCHIIPTAGCIRWQPGCWTECRPCGPCIIASCQPCQIFQGGSGGGGFGTLGS
jgi:hypothetical protein